MAGTWQGLHLVSMNSNGLMDVLRFSKLQQELLSKTCFGLGSIVVMVIYNNSLKSLANDNVLASADKNREPETMEN